MEQLPINSDTVNKTIDMVNESTKETRKELDKTTAKGINKLAQLFWASPIGIKADIYIQERPYKMKKAFEEMRMKYDKNIPPKYQTEPSSYIALKGVNELAYYLDEEYLKEMFQNLLVSDMDSRKQSHIEPAYIEIVKQLSKSDARLLKFIKENKLFHNEPIIKLLQINHSDGGHTYPSNDIWLIANCTPQLIPAIVIDNLLRLKIIEIDFTVFRTDQHIYDGAFQKIKNATPLGAVPDVVKNLNFSKGVLKVTDFGKNFIDICLS